MLTHLGKGIADMILIYNFPICISNSVSEAKCFNELPLCHSNKVGCLDALLWRTYPFFHFKGTILALTYQPITSQTTENRSALLKDNSDRPLVQWQTTCSVKFGGYARTPMEDLWLITTSTLAYPLSFSVFVFARENKKK